MRKRNQNADRRNGCQRTHLAPAPMNSHPVHDEPSQERVHPLYCMNPQAIYMGYSGARNLRLADAYTRTR
jgi:hypothetical protein